MLSKTVQWKFQRRKLLFPQPSTSLAQVSTERVLSAVVLNAVTDVVRKDENVKWLVIIKMQCYVHHVTVSKTTN